MSDKVFRDGAGMLGEITVMHAESDVGKTMVCQRCGSIQNQVIEEHICPYRADIDADYETLCMCCENCQHECAMDI